MKAINYNTHILTVPNPRKQGLLLWDPVHVNDIVIYLCITKYYYMYIGCYASLYEYIFFYISVYITHIVHAPL